MDYLALRNVPYAVSTILLLIALYLYCFQIHSLGIIQMSQARRGDEDMMDADELIRIQTGNPPFAMNDPMLIQHIRKRLIRPSQKPLKLYHPDKLDQSQVNQSQVIDEILGGRRGGFYVEVGAGLGEDCSNSIFFERARGWTGLLIEASTYNFENVLNTRRHAYNLFGCLNPLNQTKTLDFNLASTGGSTEDISKSGYFKGRDLRAKMKVQSYPLYSILLALGIDHIDYFSLDVEGAELSILKTVPFSAVRIDTFTIENKRFNETGIDYDANRKGLDEIKKIFDDTNLYDYKGTIPKYENQPDWNGLDVVFARKDIRN